MASRLTFPPLAQESSIPWFVVPRPAADADSTDASDEAVPEAGACPRPTCFLVGLVCVQSQPRPCHHVRLGSIRGVFRWCVALAAICEAYIRLWLGCAELRELQLYFQALRDVARALSTRLRTRKKVRSNATARCSSTDFAGCRLQVWLAQATRHVKHTSLSPHFLAG